MKTNVTFSIGNVALIEKVNEKYQLFNRLFDNIGTKVKNINNSAKCFLTLLGRFFFYKSTYLSFGRTFQVVVL